MIYSKECTTGFYAKKYFFFSLMQLQKLPQLRLQYHLANESTQFSGLAHYTTVGHCPDLCTSVSRLVNQCENRLIDSILLFLSQFQSLPKRGIRVFSGMPHTHNLGTSVRVRHIRSGVERPVPFQDRFFDPNYQTMRRFEFDLMPVSCISYCCIFLDFTIAHNGINHLVLIYSDKIILKKFITFLKQFTYFQQTF